VSRRLGRPVSFGRAGGVEVLPGHGCTVDDDDDDFIYPDPSPKRYAGYNNYIYLIMYMYILPLPENELRASSRPVVA
jgi:hypothetical protein